RSANSRLTASAFDASQAKVLAPTSAASAPRSSTLRAASATFMPARAKARAIDALNPEPAPTISASFLSSAMMPLPSDGAGVRPGSSRSASIRDLGAALLHRRRHHHNQDADGDDDKAEADRARYENRGVALRHQHGSAQVLLHHRAEDEA